MSKKIIEKGFKTNVDAGIKEYVDYYSVNKDKDFAHIKDIECPHCKKLIELRSTGFDRGQRISKCTECSKDIAIFYTVDVKQITTIEVKKVKIG